jgi:hypothetical protein
MPCWKGKGAFPQSGFGRFPTYRAASKPNAAGTSMLLDRPIPKALFYCHVRLEAKRNALNALSCFGTDRTSTQAAAQDPLRKEGVYDTHYDTNRNERETAPSDLPENNGRPEWTRTIDLLRVREAL